MATLEQYKDKVFASHPELIDQFVQSDLEEAYGRKHMVEAEIAELEQLQSELHPAPADAPSEPATGGFAEGDQPEESPEVVNG